MLYQEKVPYLLTILFAALSWTISQVSNEIGASPVIEYSHSIKMENSNYKHVFELTNISSSTVFNDLYVNLRLEKDTSAKCIGEPEIIPVPPSELRDPKQSTGVKRPTCNDKTAEYIIAQIQPGATINLVMFTDKKDSIDIYVFCKDSVMVLKSSIKTFISKHRFSVMISLIMLWTVLILLYLKMLSCQEKNGQKGD